MASRQRARAPKKERKPNQLSGLGIFDIPDLDAIGLTDTVGDESDIDDSDLESELEAILSGKTGGKRKPASEQKKKVVAPLDITKLASGMDSLSLNFEDEPEEEEDDEKLLNDPDLLNELQVLTCSEEKEGQSDEEKKVLKSPETSPKREESESILSLLNERLVVYNQALASAKTLGDNTKVRRFTRGIKTLENMIKSAKAGKQVNVEEVPPPVSIPKEPSSSVSKLSEASRVPAANIIENLVPVEEKECAPPSTEPDHVKHLDVLNSRRQKYKIAALAAKKNGDKATALEYMKIIKKFDALIQNSDETIDMSMLPPSPPPPLPVENKDSSHVPSPAKEHSEIQTSSLEAAAFSAAAEPEDPTLFDAPSAPNSVLEALEQRLEKFTSTLSAAKTDGNVSKVRRLERIVKSYEKSIALYKANKPVDLEELPVPPGFAPIPVVATSPQEGASVSPSSKLEKPAKNPSELAPTRPAPKVPSKNVEPPQKKPKVHTPKSSTLADKQLEFLLERQRLFREAAITAKKNGNTQEAMEYLRLSKGFTSMCEAVKCGLPVDMSSIPTPPQLVMSDSGFEIIDSFECDTDADAFDTFNLILKDLNQQIEMCKNNKQRFLALGDVSAATKFEKLYLESQKDLSVVVNMKNLGESPPKFHYETRVFSIVQCNADLTDDELAVSVERGINLPGKPNELDSFVRVEFPIPSDAPQKAKTHVIRDTTNPSFQQEFKFLINRKSRAQQRQFKRQCLKLEVISKGGFLRSDNLLGTVSIRLVDFESQCTIHDSFDLMDGRKNVGGKLECKVRVRQPLVNKQIEQVREKWLVIGS